MSTRSSFDLDGVFGWFLSLLLGPDDDVPFVVMSRARNWSLVKTIWITIVCGIGHVGSSVVLGMAGVALGISIGKLESIESYRGDIAGWALIAFGLVYFVWGLRRAIRNHPHTHLHLPGIKQSEPHTHEDGTTHVHPTAEKTSMTPWVLFTVFVLGPCEPLIPILMYPAARHSTSGVVMVTAIFGIVTITTMVTVVMVGSMSTQLLPVRKMERFTHAIAGATITCCGVAVHFLGL